MKTEGYVFSVIGAFLGIATVVYWFMSKDPTGSIALLLSFGLGALIGSYLLFTSRRLAGPRPEDRPDADVADGAGELGHFTPRSIWPVLIAFSASLVTLGIAFGVWLSVLGAVLIIGAVIGLVFENYVGDHPAALQDGNPSAAGHHASGHH